MAQPPALEVNHDIFDQAIALSVRLKRFPPTESDRGVSRPLELSLGQQKTLLGLISGMGELTRLMNEHVRLLKPDELEMKWFDIVPDLPIVVVRPKDTRTQLRGAAESYLQTSGFRSIDIAPGVDDYPKGNTTLRFDASGHVVQVLETGMRPDPASFAVGTVEADQDHAVFLVGVPPKDFPPAAFVLVFDNCQPAEAGFAAVAAVNVIAG